MRAAGSFKFHKEPPAEATEQELARIFPAGPDGLISDDELAAEIERQKAAQA